MSHRSHAPVRARNRRFPFFFATALLIVALASGGQARASSVPAKPHSQLVAEVMAFLQSDVGYNGILTMDADPAGAPVPPYFYHYAIQHTDNLRSSTTGYPGYASISYPGFTMSIAIDAFLSWWIYSGDPEGLARARACADWIVDRRTPATDLYANWPYSTQTDGVMGGGYDLDAVMSDKPGMFGRRLLDLYDVTGDVRYFDAAVEIADTYVATQRSGGVEEDGRWPFRVRPSDGLVRQDYTSHLIDAIRLLEELQRRRPGFGYGTAAARAWAWLENNPMDPASPSYMRWEGFYEDIGPESAGLRDHYSAEATAAALLARGAPGDVEKAIEIRDWSTATFLAPDGIQNGSGLYHPSMLEWQAWMNSTYAATAQWGVLQLRLDRATRGTALHDSTWHELGVQAMHTLTWGQAPASSVPTDDGRMLTTIRELTQPTFGRETWYEQNFNTVLYLLQAFDLEPSLAPIDEDHVLGVDDALPQIVEYGNGRVRCVFADSGAVRIKLASPPRAVKLAGYWTTTPGVQETGGSWLYDPLTQVCAIVHPAGEVVLERDGATATFAPLGLQLRVSPNPFYGAARVEAVSALAGPHRIELFDLRGRRLLRVRAVIDSGVPWVWDWNGRDGRGRSVAAGTYLLRLSTPQGQSLSRRVLRVR